MARTPSLTCFMSWGVPPPCLLRGACRTALILDPNSPNPHQESGSPDWGVTSQTLLRITDSTLGMTWKPGPGIYGQDGKAQELGMRSGPGAGRGLGQPTFCGMGTSPALPSWSLSSRELKSGLPPMPEHTPVSVCCFPGGQGFEMRSSPHTLTFKTL